MSMRDDSDANLEWKLDQEIKRRIAAEDAMAVLQQQCNEMVSRLPYVDEEGNVLVDDLQSDWDDAHQAQRIVVAREVAASVARGAVKAELEEELETVVAEKNREVARLRDKLQYFELVNHEMSQRNQEAIGMFLCLLLAVVILLHHHTYPFKSTRVLVSSWLFCI